ncbi:MAG: class I SAM-dependent methyltransferase [Lachnospiraceae bacterium]|nr:class I SAM-dependent methyltransferase [Lachnospiraceae bacterium]
MKADFEDFLIDAKLNISTTGRNAGYSDKNNYPYEGTSYAVLDRLIEGGYISRDDHVLDYGCGKGRVAIYLNHRIGCPTMGVELMEEFYDKAVSNLERYKKTVHIESQGDIIFIKHAAQTFEVPQYINRIFFFNPFSGAVFKSVLARVAESYYEAPRRILMFFYYPESDYLSYLARADEVMFLDEIDCMDLFPEKDERNRVMIYEMPG